MTILTATLLVAEEDAQSREPHWELFLDDYIFDEIYGMCAIHTEGMVLGFIEWFIGDQTRPEFSVLAQELIGRVHMKGPMEIRIATSRDGGFT